MIKVHLALCLISVFVVFEVIVCPLQQKCTALYLLNVDKDAITVFENQYISVTFWVNFSTCGQTNTSHRITVHTRTNDDSLEYDGTITYWKDSCIDTYNTSVRCTTPTGPAKLHRKVNRSHVETEWHWKDLQFGNFITIKEKLKLHVLHPPSVISLTANGHNINGSHLTDEGQINISCSFDRGNPPSNVFLRIEHGKEMTYFRVKEYLNHSLTVQCTDDWPTIRCEGNGSERNVSVPFLVRCPPKFTDRHPKVITGAASKRWLFNVKAPTTEIQSCLLTSLPLEKYLSREVNCTLTGDPPDLLLTVILDKENGTEGNWSLRLFNEKGPSDALIFNIFSKKSPTWTPPGRVAAVSGLELSSFNGQSPS